MRFNSHAAFTSYLGVTVGTGFRFVAAIAVLGIILRFNRMEGNKVGAMRPGHELSLVRQALF